MAVLVNNTVDEWASAAGTINYEIVTRIGPTRA
jgi:alanine racemase